MTALTCLFGSIRNSARRLSSRSRALSAVAVAAAGMAACLFAPAANAAPAPAWSIESIPSPSHFIPGDSEGLAMYFVTFTNVGRGPTDGSPITLTDELPSGVTLNPFPAAQFVVFQGLNDGEQGISCSEGATIVCTTSEIVHPSERFRLFIPVDVEAGAPPVLTNHISVVGGGAGEISADEQTPVDTEPAPFDFRTLTTSATAEDGTAETRAGAHPYQLNLNLELNTYRNPAVEYSNAPILSPRNLVVTLPRGVVANPNATPVHCTELQFESEACPRASAVGIIHEALGLFGFADTFSVPLWSMVASPGAPATFAFQPTGFPIYIHVLGGVDPSGNYALSATTRDILEYGNFSGASATLWGDPSDPSHDYRRGYCAYPGSIGDGGGFGSVCPVSQQETPFLTMPTSCTGPYTSKVSVDTWAEPGKFTSASAPMTDLLGNPVGMTACNALEFEPTLEARPTTNVADSPSGLSVHLHIPQNDNFNTLATAHLKETVVTLPEGLTINPSGGNGLKGCSSAEIGIDPGTGVPNGTEPTCPDASKIGSVEVDTPLLDHPLPGAVYVATPHDNPFDSLLAIYIAIDDPQTGVIVKLAGHVVADPNTGRLTTTFADNPQLPFSDFKLSFHGGSTAPLRTPAVCGNYATTSSLTPWSAPDSGPPATPEDGWAIEQGANGGACPTSSGGLPSTPSLDAGTVSPIAGAYSPTVVNLRRQDGTQQFRSVTLTPPQGLVGKLAGIPYCPQSALDAAAARSGRAEEASSSCPAASQVGTADVAAGAGPAPYNAKGKVYLTGPYKGAPLSLAIITPATAGPFDLGTVVVRTALYVDSRTTQITAVSDPIPSILQGIPLDVRSALIKLDRPNFTLNPTSCDPMAFGGTLLSTLGQATPLSSRFQLGECGRLGFKPRLALSLKGGTVRNAHPALTAVLTPRPGDANLASISVALPHSEFLDQAHIGTICTRVQFAVDQCPAASIYGTATVTTPLLDYPLTGNVYLRSSDNPLPDLVPDLRGPANQPIKLEADGRTDSIHAGIRNTFDFVPDAPFSKFVLSLRGGAKGLLVNSRNICAKPYKATVKYGAHNGLRLEARPLLKANCPQARKHHKKHHPHKRRAG